MIFLIFFFFEQKMAYLICESTYFSNENNILILWVYTNDILNLWFHTNFYVSQFIYVFERSLSLPYLEGFSVPSLPKRRSGTTHLVHSM